MFIHIKKKTNTATYVTGHDGKNTSVSGVGVRCIYEARRKKGVRVSFLISVWIYMKWVFLTTEQQEILLSS